MIFRRAWVLIFLLASCAHQDVVEPPAENPNPSHREVSELTSFSPDSAAIGDTIRITGKHFLTDSMVLVLLGNVRSRPLTVSDSLLTLVVPPWAITGKVGIELKDTVLFFKDSLFVRSPIPPFPDFKFLSVSVGGGNGFGCGSYSSKLSDMKKDTANSLIKFTQYFDHGWYTFSIDKANALITYVYSWGMDFTGNTVHESEWRTASFKSPYTLTSDSLFVIRRGIASEIGIVGANYSHNRSDLVDRQNNRWKTIIETSQTIKPADSAAIEFIMWK